jgi:hypothetical protein
MSLSQSKAPSISINSNDTSLHTNKPTPVDFSQLTLPPKTDKISLDNALAQNSPNKTGGGLFDAVDDILNAGLKAANGDRAGALKDARRAADNTQQGAKGALNDIEAATRGTPLGQLGRDIKDLGGKGVDAAKSGADLAIDLTEMTWSNTPGQNLQAIKKIQNLLTNAKSSSIVELDKEMRDISSSNPKAIDAAKNLSQTVNQVVSLYDDFKSRGIDPAQADPKLGKFIDRLRNSSKELGDFVGDYGDYHREAQGLPQMGTAADMWDYAKARMGGDTNHVMHRINRNSAASKAVENWNKFKKDFDALVDLRDLK